MQRFLILLSLVLCLSLFGNIRSLGKAIPEVSNRLYLNGLSLSSPEASDTEPPSEGFYEDFDFNELGWEEAFDEDYIAEFRNGVYLMDFSNRAYTTEWIVFIDSNLAPEFTGSYSYQIDIRGICTGYCGAGLIFGLEPNYIDGTGIYYWPLDVENAFFRFYDNVWEEIIDDGSPDVPVGIFDGNWHTLRLEISNAGLEYFIDDKPIYAYGMGDFDSEGTVAFMMMRDTRVDEFTVEFDNLIVR